MAREAHAERARIKKEFGGEAAELIPFASWAQSSSVFPGQIKDLGLLATLHHIYLFLVIYMNRKIDPSIYPIRFIIRYKK